MQSGALRAEAGARHAWPPVLLSAPGRLAVLIGAVATVAAALPYVPMAVLVPVWLALGLVAALPGAANAAIRRGHRLRVYTPGSLLHWLRRGAFLRITWHGLVGLMAVAVLLVRLAGSGAAFWLVCGLVAGVAVLVLRHGAGLSGRFYAPVHRDAGTRRLALLVGAVVMVVASSVGAPPVWERPPAATAVIGEGLALNAQWLGAEAWLRLEIAALIPSWAGWVLAIFLLGASGWAVAALTVAALMRGADVARAAGGASDAAVALRLGAPGALLALAVLALLGWVAVVSAERSLSATAPEARPAAQAQIAAEWIGAQLHPAGTRDRIADGRARLAVLDDATMRELRLQADGGFDAMLDQVDPFLDWYYSLPADYARLWVAVTGAAQGDVEGAVDRYLTTRLTDTLRTDAHLGPLLQDLRAEGLAEARAAQALREAALLANPLDDIDPGRLDVKAAFPAFDPLPELRSIGLSSSVEARVGASAIMGGLGAVIAARVVQRLAAQGVLRLATRALLAALPVIGFALGAAADKGLLALEENLNRDDFRAEITAAIEAQRAEVLAALH